MKKQYTVIALALSATLVLTGCSWSDIRAKFVGQNGTASSVTVSEDGSVVIEDYDANKVLTLADYKGVEVDVSVTDEEIQEEIDSLLDANKETEEIKKGKAKNGYVVNIDFVGKIANGQDNIVKALCRQRTYLPFEDWYPIYRD